MSFLYTLFILFSSLLLSIEATGGSWQQLQESIGVVAMHMQLMHNDRVIIYDRTDFGLSTISLPKGKCRNDPNNTVVKHNCSTNG